MGYNTNSDDKHFGSASAEFLHTPTGLNANMVVGRNDDDGKMIYGKVGIIQSFFGDDNYKTAFYVDYYSGENINGIDSDVDSLGVAVVPSDQQLSKFIYSSII